MPTITARLDASVDDSALTAQVSAQVALLDAARAVLAALDDDPPSEVGNLLGLAGSIRLPELGSVSGLDGIFDGLAGAIPSDLDDLTAPLVEVVGVVVGVVGTELVDRVSAALDAVRAVQALLEVDLTCGLNASAGVGGAGVGAGGGGPAGGDGSGDGGGTGGAAATGAAATAARAATVAGLLDLVVASLPDPLDVPGVLRWIADRVDIDDFGLPLGIPLLEDLREPVQRLLAWDGMTGAQIRDEIATTLDGVATLLDTAIGGAVGQIEEQADPFPALLDAADLGAIADGMVTRLGDVATALDAADEAAVDTAVAALDQLLDDRDAAVATLAPALDAAPALGDRVTDLPKDLTRRLGVVDSALVGSTGIRGALGILADTADQQVTAEALDEVITPLADVGEWLADLLAALDLSALSDPVTDAATAVTDALQDLDAALLAVAVEVRGQMETARGLLDEVDVDDLRQAVTDAIDGVADDLSTTLTDVAASARAAVAAVVEALDDAVGAIDPALLVSALGDVVDAVAGVLEDPAVRDAISAVRTAIDGAVDELAAQPITPVTDAVIAAIDELADLLRGLETGLLPGPAKLALQGALALLPRSLDPVTDPLVDELDQLIAAGPLPLLEQVRQGPADVADRIRAFDPAALVDPALVGPWRELVARAEAVGPIDLLAPIADTVVDLRGRLVRELDPAAALAPLVGPHADLLAAVDEVDPAVLVAPIQAALADAAGLARAALDDDGLLAPIEAVTTAVVDAVEAVRSVRQALDRVGVVLAGLAGLDDELVVWVDAIFARLAATNDDGTLASATGSLTAAVDATRSAALVARVEAAVEPTRTRLQDVAPGDRLAAVVAARRAITAADVATLPAGSTRDALAAILDRCDPLATSFARPFRVLADLDEALGTATTVVPTDLADWDGRHHGPDGVLAEYRDLAPDPAALGQQARAALDDRFLDPARAVLRVAEPVSALLGGIAGELADVLDVADQRLAELIAAPAAFAAIRTEVVGLADRVAGVDLAVLTDALEEAVATVRSGVEALSPSALAADLEGAIDDLLAVVTVDLLVPAAELATLEATYQDVVDALRALDPVALVTEVVGPTYDLAVTPLVDALDLTPTIDALVARLDEFPGELRAELDRVDAAYQGLLRAVPSIDLTDLALDLDAELSSPF